MLILIVHHNHLQRFSYELNRSLQLRKTSLHLEEGLLRCSVGTHGQLPYPLCSSFLGVPNLLRKLARSHVVLHCRYDNYSATARHQHSR